MSDIILLGSLHVCVIVLPVGSMSVVLDVITQYVLIADQEYHIWNNNVYLN